MAEVATTQHRAFYTREYVAGNVSSFQSRNMLRGLPWAFDDLSRDFGDDIYERILLDPAARAVNNTLISGILEEGATLTTAVDDRAADGYDLAHEISAFCESVLCDLETPLDDVLWDMLGAVALGSRVAEKVYQLAPSTSYSLPDTTPIQRGQELLTLSALKVKPRRSLAFVVDPFMSTIGLLGRPPGGAISTTVVSDTTRNIANLLPREKFAVLSFRPENNDPRGTSVLRPAYTPWWTKQQIYPEFLKYLAQFASPSISVIASEDATKHGITVTLDDGSTVTKPAVEVLGEAILAFQNGTGMAFPYGTILDALEVTGDGSAFHKAFTFCDQQIALAVLHQTLATLEAEHQARASSETHQDTLETIIRQAKRAVCVMLRRDVLRPLVAYNYGMEAARQLTPSVSLGSVERTDLPAMMTAIAALTKASYLHPSQFAGTDAQLNLPPRDLDATDPATGQPIEDVQDQEQDQEEGADEAV